VVKVTNDYEKQLNSQLHQLHVASKILITLQKYCPLSPTVSMTT